MYKRFSLTDLRNIQSNMITGFLQVLRKEFCQLPQDLFKKIFKEGTDIYYFNRSDAFFRCSLKPDGTVLLVDEKDRIELFLDEQGKREFTSYMKQVIIKKNKNGSQQTIENILLKAFVDGEFDAKLDKPYLVYDIETTMSDHIHSTEFLLGYAMEVRDGKMHYEYIDQAGLKAFVQKMLEFDGYIVGYNNIAFDNPVSIHNIGFTPLDLEIINKKSIDIFLFIQNLTGKRIGLNKVANALVGIQKTLESGAEGETLWKKYHETGDEKFLEEFKLYCKNDVRMTALVFLYLLYYQKICIEWEEIMFEIDEFIQKSVTQEEVISSEQNKAVTLFS